MVNGIVPTDAPEPGAFQAMLAALAASSYAVTGPAVPHLLVIPIRDQSGQITGGLWGHTLFGWLHVEILVVPEPLRRKRIGSALIRAAETEALARGCHGIVVDTFSFEAPAFYEKLGFSQFGALDDFPLGHRRLYFRKHLNASASPAS